MMPLSQSAGFEPAWEMALETMWREASHAGNAPLQLQIQALHNNPFRPHRSRLLIISLDID